jgi:hypothetical protein
MGSIRKELVGERFGRLVVQKASHKDKYGKWHWNCFCDCGNITVVSGCSLRNGLTSSCGCWRKDHLSEVSYIHGFGKTNIARIRAGIIQRCYNPSNKAYHNYGGRGITMCDEWKKNPLTFYRWAMANGYEKGQTIERINNDGNYEPENCRWATQKEQCNNTRHNNLITFRGETKTIGDWAKSIGTSHGTIAYRLKEKWTDEEALTSPPGTRRKDKTKRKKNYEQRSQQIH